MSHLSGKELARELASQHFWRRQTARRLLIELQAADAVPNLRQLLRDKPETSVVLGALYALDGLGQLTVEDVRAALANTDSAVRVHAMRLSERWLDDQPDLLETCVSFANQDDPAVLIQLAMSLGESKNDKVVPVLARLVQEHSKIRWMRTAVLSSLSDRSGEMLAELVVATGDTEFLERLGRAIAGGRRPDVLSKSLAMIAGADDRGVQTSCLRGLKSGFQQPTAIDLSSTGLTALQQMTKSQDSEIRALARDLVVSMRAEHPDKRRARLVAAKRDLGDNRLTVTRRLAAVEELAIEADPAITNRLLDSFANATPIIRAAILDAILSQRGRLPTVVKALKEERLPVSALSAVQRELLRQQLDEPLRTQVVELFQSTRAAHVSDLRPYIDALEHPRDIKHGEEMFREHCASCHRTQGIGHTVGPDLTSEARRSEETIVRDILIPNDVIAAGFSAYLIESTDGRSFTGLLAAESPSSVTLRQSEGKEQVVLRKEIDFLNALAVSLMPEGMNKKVGPKDVADLIAWLQQRTGRRVLFDEDSTIAAQLSDGGGTVSIERDDRYSGHISLRVTPPQRYSARLANWSFRVREIPTDGEYRFLRFAWKSAGARGVMIELANNGRWPSANDPKFRFYSGINSTGWQAVEVAHAAPTEWVVVTRDLWAEFGDSTITGMAPTAMDGPALFDGIQLLRSIDD